MYKYAAIIISVFCFFFSGCEEKATPPPAKPKIVHKKIDRKPAAKAQPAVSSSVAEAGAAVESGSAGPEPTLTEQDLQDVVFIAADANEHPQAYQYGVSSVPTLLFFNGKDVLGQNVGFVPEKPLHDFLKKLEREELAN